MELLNLVLAQIKKQHAVLYIAFFIYLDSIEQSLTECVKNDAN